MDRKDLHLFQLVGIIICVLGVWQTTDAQNLVPNPSFEEHSACPDNYGQIELAIGWTWLVVPTNYYHQCGEQPCCGIPVSRGGGGYARSGEAYGLVSLWAKDITSGRSFLEVELTEPLSVGISYRCQFYISMQDSLWYATRNIGAHFSDVPHSQDVNVLLNLTPQVSYSDTAFLDDKIRWVGISGSFVAQGGERYLAIGNFDDDAHTDTVLVPGGGSGVLQPEDYWYVSGYFVDDVSVVPDSIYLATNEVENRTAEMNLYPNPNAGEFMVDLDMEETDVAVLSVWNISGQMLHQESLISGHHAISIAAAQGLYLYTVHVNGELKWTGKISIADPYN